MAIVSDGFEVCDREKILDATKHRTGFRCLHCRWRSDEEIASRAIQLYPESILYTDYKSYNIGNRMVERN